MASKRAGALVVLSSALCAAAGVRADLVAIWPAQDNTLYQDAGGMLSNGQGAALFAGRNSQGLVRRGLLAFDVAAAVPAGAQVMSVSLRLHMSQGNEPVTSVGLHRVLAGWGEGGSIAGGAGGGGGPAMAGDATWLHRYFDQEFWTTPGGDFAPGASAAVNIGGVGHYTWASAQLTADVQAFLDAPGSNFGWLIAGDESGASTSKRFDSREHTSESLRPLLTIEYTPIPSPGGLAVFAAGLFVGRRRSRRGL